MSRDELTLPFRVDRWDDRAAENHVETLALVRHLYLGRAVLAAALAEQPDAVLTLRQGAMVMGRSPRMEELEARRPFSPMIETAETLARLAQGRKRRWK